MPRVEVFRTNADIVQLRQAWESLQHHPNTAWSQYQLVISNLPGVIHPLVLAAYQGSEPECLLIGRVEVNRFVFPVGYAKWFRPRVRYLVFMHEGVLGSTSDLTAPLILQKVKDALTEEAADFAFFNSYRENSPVYKAALQQAACNHGGLALTLRRHRSMSIPASKEEFWQRLSPKARKNLRRQCRRIEDQYQHRLTVTFYQGQGDLDKAIMDCELVAAKTYQRGLNAGFSVSGFSRTSMALQASLGQFRASILYIDDLPCAFWVGRLFEGTFYSGSMGYDAQYRAYSPGMYLIVRTIEKLCASNNPTTGDCIKALQIDFGLGDAQYKEVLGESEWMEGTIFVFSPSLRGQLLRVIFSLLALADRFGRWCLLKANRLNQVKRVWRKTLRT